MNTTFKPTSYGHRAAMARIIGGALLFPITAKATDDGRALMKMPEPQQVSLVVGKSMVVDMPMVIKRASLADPQVADAPGHPGDRRRTRRTA